MNALTQRRVLKSVVVVSVLALLVAGCTSLGMRKNYVCPTCHKTEMITHYYMEDDPDPTYEFVKVKCPTCGEEYALDELKETYKEIHACEKCGTMIEQCQMCLTKMKE